MSENPFVGPVESVATRNFEISAKVSDAARSVGTTGATSGATTNVLREDGTIIQTERLFTTRSRAAVTNGTSDSIGDNSGFRGNYAYIKLVTSQEQAKEYMSGKTARELTYSKLAGSGSELANMSDPSGQNASGYDKFLLTGVSANMSEKVQITEVFGDGEVAYYFGRQPMVFNLSGILIDSPDNNWFVTWLRMFSDVLRGTQLAKNYELLTLVLPNMTITGSIMGFAWDQRSERDVDIPFSFQFLAKSVVPTEPVVGHMITSNALNAVDFSQANLFVSQSSINSLKAQMTTFTTTIQDPKASLQDKGTALQGVGAGVGGALGVSNSSTKDAINGFQKRVEGWTKSETSYFSSVKKSAMFQTVTSSLMGIRTNLFAPIYGVMTSLSKLVSNTFKQVKGVFDAIIQPVRNILRDITNISKKAIALVNQINSSIRGFGRYVKGQLKGVKKDYKDAIKNLKKAAGVVATAPTTISQSISHMFRNGAIPSSSPFLSNSIKSSFSRPVLTASLPSSGSGASLSVRRAVPVNKAAILRTIPPYDPVTSNTL